MKIQLKKLLVWQETIDHGYDVFETHPLARIDEVSKELWIGSKKVQGYDHDEFEGNIPSQYLVKVFDKERYGGMWGSNAGFDLLTNGKVFISIGCQEFYTTEEAFMVLEKEKPGFELFTEEYTTI